MTSDEKKYLVIGGLGGAAVIFVGSWLLGSRPALARPQLPEGRQARRHDQHEKRHRHGDRHGDHDNRRGEYGRKKKHRRHKRHRHGD